MSLLEKFVLMFETDAGKSAKEVRQLNESLDDTDEAAGKAASQVDDLKRSVTDLVTAYIGLKAIKASIFDMARADDVVAKFSNTLGFNIEMIDAYGAAVERSGGSAEGFRGSIAGLKSQLDDLQNYGAGDIAQTLSRIGVNAVDSTGKIKDAMSLLPELADAFGAMSARESSFYGSKLGLDQGTIALLQQSRYAMENLVEQQRQLGGRTAETTKAAEDFNDRVDNGQRLFQSYFTKANATILPALKSIFDGFFLIGDWMKNNEDLVTGFFVVVGGAITASLIPVMWRLAVATTAATWPFILMAAAVGAIGIAFAAVYEDVKAYVNGQESFIGKLLEKYEWLGDGIDAVMKGISYAFEQIQKDIDWVKLLFTDPMQAIGQLKQGFIDLYNYIKGLFDFSFIGDSIDGALNSTKKFFGLGGDDEQKTREIDQNAEDLPVFGSDNIIQNTKKGLSMQSDYAKSPINTMSKSTAFNSQSRNQKINITLGEVKVDASGMSPSEAQSVFGDTLRNQISDALGYLNDGVVA